MFTASGDKRRVSDEFDAKAEIYDSYRLAGWYHAHNDLIAEHLHLDGSDRLLDVGCATGYLIRHALGTGPGISAIGVDLSPRMISIAEEQTSGPFAGRARFFCDDWESPGAVLIEELSGCNISHAACASVLHYFSDPVASLRRIRDVLAPGGALFLLERRREGSLPTRAWDLAHRHLLRDHVRFYGTDQLLDMLEKAGFSHADVVQNIRKYFWHNKISTNLSLIKAVR